MSGIKKGQITSADNGTQVPTSTGFTTSGPFDFSVLNGTTISATLQKKSALGNWVTIPQPDSRTTLSGADTFRVDYLQGGTFRIDVTTATGTWDWEAEENN